MGKIWKIALLIIIIVIAFFFPVILAAVGEWAVTAGFINAAQMTAFAALIDTIPWWVGAVVGVGLAFVVDPATTSEIFADITTGVGTLVKDVVDVAGDTLADTVFSPAGLAIGAFALWFFLRRDDQRQSTLPSTEVDRPGTPAEGYT